MLFSSISNLNMYAKNLKMSQKWMLRQQELQRPKMESGVLSQLNAMKEARAKRYSVAGLTLKLQMGKKLTADEMEFLRENAPELYEKALRIAKEREEYERQLKKCKTKEEVRSLNMSYMGSITTKSGQDPMLANAINDEHTTFVASSEYKDLPDNWKEVEEHKEAERARKKKSKNKGTVDIQLVNKQELNQDFMEKIREKEAAKVAKTAEKGKEGETADLPGTDIGSTSDSAQPQTTNSYTENRTYSYSYTERNSNRGFTAKA